MEWIGVAMDGFEVGMRMHAARGRIMPWGRKPTTVAWIAIGRFATSSASAAPLEAMHKRSSSASEPIS